MRRFGWTWEQLQATPENVLGYLALIDSWEARKSDGEARSMEAT